MSANNGIVLNEGKRTIPVNVPGVFALSHGWLSANRESFATLINNIKTAIETANYENSKKLIMNISYYQIKESIFQTVLSIMISVIKTQDIELVKHFYTTIAYYNPKRGSFIDTHGSAMLLETINLNSIKGANILNYLLSVGFNRLNNTDLNNDSIESSLRTKGTLLSHACKLGNIHCVKVLFAYEADPNYRPLLSNYALLQAIFNEKYNVADLILERFPKALGINEPFSGKPKDGIISHNYILTHAFVQKNIVMMRWLMAHGAIITMHILDNLSSADAATKSIFPESSRVPLTFAKARYLEFILIALKENRPVKVSYLSQISNVNVPKLSSDGSVKIVCDPRGYSQHTGECGHDSFQQSVMFADGLKGVTQPFFLTMSNDDIKQRIDETLQSILTTKYNGKFKTDVLQKAEDAIFSMKKRFLNRYKFLTSINQADLKRAINAPHCIDKQTIITVSTALSPNERNAPKLTASRSCQYGIESSVTLKDLSVFMHNLPTTPIYQAGSTMKQVLKLWEFIIKLFDLQLTVELKNDPSQFSTTTIPEKNIKVIQFSGPAIYDNCTFDKLCNADGTPKKYDDVIMSIGPNRGHSVSLYKCDGSLQYYDDNLGSNGMPTIDIKHLNKIDGIIINNERVMPLWYNNDSFHILDPTANEFIQLTKALFESYGPILSIMIFREKIYITKPSSGGGSKTTRRNDRKMRKQTRKTK